MNIFIIDKDPVEAAKQYHDSHVVKIILECAQCLCNVFHAQGIDAPYRKTHFNHPVSIWMRQSNQNYRWAVTHLRGLLDEYTFRYNKNHKTESVYEWIVLNTSKLRFPEYVLTPFALAMPDEYKCRNSNGEYDTVKSYRAYYISQKLTNKNGKLHKWTNRKKPEWIEHQKKIHTQK